MCIINHSQKKAEYLPNFIFEKTALFYEENTIECNSDFHAEITLQCDL